MTQQIGLGSDQPLVANDERSLIENIEAVIDFCLEIPSAFAMVDFQGGFCQVFVDQSISMHIGSSYGVLLVHPDVHESVDGVDSPGHSVLPSTWPTRSRMAAEAMTRVFIDAGTMTFPAELRVEIVALGNP